MIKLECARSIAKRTESVNGVSKSISIFNDDLMTSNLIRVISIISCSIATWVFVPLGSLCWPID